MATKHSYMDESEKNPDPQPVEKGTSDKDQKNLERTDPAVKKGYNEKKPTQPQGGFKSESQTEEASENNNHDESQ